MAYSAYEPYGYPLQHSLSHGAMYGAHPTEYSGYADPAYGGAYDVSTIHSVHILAVVLITSPAKAGLRAKRGVLCIRSRT